MSFIGDDSSLIHINGGIAAIEGNAFRYLGYLSSEQVANNPSNIKHQYKKVYFPYESYSFTNAQKAGAIVFKFENYDVPGDFSHRVYRNAF